MKFKVPEKYNLNWPCTTKNKYLQSLEHWKLFLKVGLFISTTTKLRTIIFRNFLFGDSYIYTCTQPGENQDLVFGSLPLPLAPKSFPINHKPVPYSCGKNSGLGRTNQTMLRFGQEIDDRYPFFESDNSDKAKFGSKSNSDNRNVKNVMSGFKIWTKNSCPYPIFSRSDKFEYSGRTNFCQH